MAGAFGFEKEHYDVSMKIAEHKLLPKLRQSPPNCIVLADGFSCREQIEQLQCVKDTSPRGNSLEFV